MFRAIKFDISFALFVHYLGLGPSLIAKLPYSLMYKL